MEQEDLLTRRAHFGNGLHWFSQKKSSKPRMYVLAMKNNGFWSPRSGHQGFCGPNGGGNHGIDQPLPPVTMRFWLEKRIFWWNNRIRWPDGPILAMDCIGSAIKSHRNHQCTFLQWKTMVFEAHGGGYQGFCGPNGGGNHGIDQPPPPVTMRFDWKNVYLGGMKGPVANHWGVQVR